MLHLHLYFSLIASACSFQSALLTARFSFSPLSLPPNDPCISSLQLFFFDGRKDVAVFLISVSFHFFNGLKVFAEVVHGAKRWFLSPPDKQPVFSPDETSYRWYRFVYSNDSYQDSKEFSSLLECTLYPNEVRPRVQSSL